MSEITVRGEGLNLGVLTKHEFDVLVESLSIELDLFNWMDITMELASKGYKSYEIIYELKDSDSSSVLIFSTVDIRTFRTRDSRRDSIKIIYKMKVDGDNKFYRISRHYRTMNLQKNMLKKIKKFFKDFDQGKITIEDFTDKLHEAIK